MGDDLTMLGPDGIRRSYDEHYDTMMEVKQDPTGAHQAIQRQHDHIEQLAATNEELEAKLAKAVEEAEKYKHAIAAQSRKLQAVLHIDGVRTTLAELKGETE